MADATTIPFSYHPLRYSVHLRIRHRALKYVPPTELLYGKLLWGAATLQQADARAKEIALQRLASRCDYAADVIITEETHRCGQCQGRGYRADRIGRRRRCRHCSGEGKRLGVAKDFSLMPDGMVF